MSDRGPEDDRDDDYSPARYRLPSLEEDEPRQLWRPILLALVVTVLFAGMIWFAYSRGVQEGAERVPPRIAAALAADPSITRALAAGGVPDYRRRTTRVTARMPTPEEAELLQQSRTRPVLATA